MKERSKSRRGLTAFAGLTALTALGIGAFWMMPQGVEPAAAAAVAETAPVAQAAADPAPVQLAQTDGAAAPAAPSTTTTTTTKYGAWTVSCSAPGDAAKKTCTALLRVATKDKNATVLVWLVGRNKEGKLLSEFTTMSDVVIAPGVAITLDANKPVKADYTWCSTKGCKASMELTPSIARQLKAAKKAQVGITRLDGKVMQFGLELTGIDQSLAELGV